MFCQANEQKAGENTQTAVCGVCVLVRIDKNKYNFLFLSLIVLIFFMQLTSITNNGEFHTGITLAVVSRDHCCSRTCKDIVQKILKNEIFQLYKH